MYLAKMILTQAEKYKLFRKNPKFWNSAVSTKPTGAICESKKKEFKSSNQNFEKKKFVKLKGDLHCFYGIKTNFHEFFHIKNILRLFDIKTLTNLSPIKWPAM